MRERGTGTIEETSTGFRPRLPGRASKRLPTCATHEEAEEVLAAALAQLATDPAQGGLSLATWGDQVIDRRDLGRQRAAGSYRSVWRSHVASSWLGKLPLVTIGRGDVVAWVKELATKTKKPGKGHGEAIAAQRAKELIARSTAQNALNIVRIVLGEAVDEELIEENFAEGLRLPAAIRKRRRTHETWTYLSPAEQQRLLTSSKIPLRERLAMGFAIGTGARQTEQWNVRLADIDTTRWTVTLRVTKNGKPRTIPLLPIARAAVEEWLPLLAEERADRARRRAKRGIHEKLPPLLWPSLRGLVRSGDPKNWQRWMNDVGLGAEKRRDGKHVRWHDLRHTCATSLVQGWWGRRWALEEVQVQLDHESITTTERYAHLDSEMARRAAEETPDLTIDVTTPFGTDRQKQRESLEPPSRLELETYGLRSPWENEQVRSLTPLNGASVVRSLAEVAREVLELVGTGDPTSVAWAVDRAVELATRVLAGEAVREPEEAAS